MRDRINLVYSDAPFSLSEHFARVSMYADELRNAAMEALEEEAVLIAVFQVYHAE
jgi:hypothetical protein